MLNSIKDRKRMRFKLKNKEKLKVQSYYALRQLKLLCYEEA